MELTPVKTEKRELRVLDFSGYHCYLLINTRNSSEEMMIMGRKLA
jgi:hypothetical protein